jgi:hypothetical protein
VKEAIQWLLEAGASLEAPIEPLSIGWVKYGKMVRKKVG